MKTEWQTRPLGEVCERVTVGHVGITAPYYRDEGVMFLRTQNVGKLGLDLDDVKYITPEFHASLKKSEVKSGDILMSRVITHTVNCALVPSDLGVANCANVVLVRPGKAVIPEFLTHYIRSPIAQKHLLDRKVGSAQLVVNTTVVKDWPVPLPPLAEQQRIVGILDEAFDGIATAKANAEKNLQNARALFESHLQSVFTQRGEGWVEKRLGDIAEVQSGGTPLVSNKSFWGGKIAWYSSGELNNLHTTEPERHITTAGLNGSNAKLFPKGSLLIGMYDTAALKMSILDRDAAFNQAIAGVKPNDRVDLIFVLHAINAVKPFLLSQRRGVRQKNLSLSKIKEVTLNLPLLSEQQDIVARLYDYAAETQRLESLYQRKLDALDALKKSLLHQAFSGAL